MVQTAAVAVEGATIAFDKPYSYLVPPGWHVLPGMRVRVSFGAGNRGRTALVLACEAQQEPGRLKPLTAVLDEQPLLGDEGLRMLHFLREHTFCTYFDALRLLIPAGLGRVNRVLYAAGNLPPAQPLSPEAEEAVAYLRSRKQPVALENLQKKFPQMTARALDALAGQGVLVRSEENMQAVRDEKIIMVRPLEEVPAKLTPKQKTVMDFLQQNGTASLKEVCYYAATTRAVVDALLKKNAVEYFDQPVLRDPFGAQARQTEMEVPPLSAQQQAAYEGLRRMMAEQKPAPALLHGITGSGKTQVYLRLMQDALDLGKTALVLVPEISLTAQAVEAFHRRFGGRVAVLHSALSVGERMDQWKRIKAGDAPIVVGTRSAVFAPLDRIGLIVIDEEQEHTYKSEQSPRFHARDVAKLRSAWHGALLVLASATPSVESYHAARQGTYRLVELADRFGKAELPDVYTVDMSDAENLSDSQWISDVLRRELQHNLEQGEQSILLLNRRGYSTVVKCSSCGTAADCPHCSVALTYHTVNQSLICHYCGFMQQAISSCAHCGSELIRYAGAGTQKLEEELSLLLPAARVLRVDMDTTMSKFSHQALFQAFLAREYDIMIGTQMVAKGLNFPDVTLVGVLNADQSLYGGDFRSFERSFSLLTQVVGRGGRGEKRGRAIIQTYSPESPIIQLAVMQDYPAFFAEEILSRKWHLYPPFCAMAGIGFVGQDEKLVHRWSLEFVAHFRACAAAEYADLPVRLLGPVPADLVKAAGKYRYKLVLKCKNNARTRALLRQVLGWFYAQRPPVHAYIDMYYDRM